MKNITELREEIDEIDKELVRLFEDRMKISLEIGLYKKKNNLQIFDEKREKEVLEKRVSYLKNKEYEAQVKSFFENIMEISKNIQK